MDNLHNLPAFRRPTASRRHTHRLTQQVRLILPLTLTIILMTAFIVSAEKKGNIGKQPIQQKKKTEIENADGNKYYLITDEINCGDVLLVWNSNCPVSLKWANFIDMFQCRHELYLKNTKEGTIKRLNIKTPVWSRGCVDNKYIAISFFTGGNCWHCEWIDVYTLSGDIVISNDADIYFHSTDELICAGGYLDFKSGYRDYSYFVESCKGMGNDDILAIKTKLEKYQEVSRKIKELTGENEEFLKFPDITININKGEL